MEVSNVNNNQLLDKSLFIKDHLFLSIARYLSPINLVKIPLLCHQSHSRYQDLINDVWNEYSGMFRFNDKQYENKQTQVQENYLKIVRTRKQLENTINTKGQDYNKQSFKSWFKNVDSSMVVERPCIDLLLDNYFWITSDLVKEHYNVLTNSDKQRVLMQNLLKYQLFNLGSLTYIENKRQELKPLQKGQFIHHYYYLHSTWGHITSKMQSNIELHFQEKENLAMDPANASNEIKLTCHLHCNLLSIEMWPTPNELKFWEDQVALNKQHDVISVHDATFNTVTGIVDLDSTGQILNDVQLPIPMFSGGFIKLVLSDNNDLLVGTFRAQKESTGDPTINNQQPGFFTLQANEEETNKQDSKTMLNILSDKIGNQEKSSDKFSNSKEQETKGDSSINSDNYTFDGKYFDNIEKIGAFTPIINLKNAIKQENGEEYIKCETILMDQYPQLYEFMMHHEESFTKFFELDALLTLTDGHLTSPKDIELETKTTDEVKFELSVTASKEQFLVGLGAHSLDLMDKEGNLREDIELPQNEDGSVTELGEEIRTKFDTGNSYILVVTNNKGVDQVTSIKDHQFE